GERRQLELAVALAQDPRVLLLDEPTAGMSPVETARITELIAGLDRALTILIVEHGMDVVVRLADSVTVLHEGRVIADGTAADVRRATRVHDVYRVKAVTVPWPPRLRSRTPLRTTHRATPFRNPTALLLDEPSEGLAPKLVEQVGEILVRLRATGLAIFLVEQNLGLATQVGQRVLVMNKGTIVFAGTPTELATHRDIEARYLG